MSAVLTEIISLLTSGITGIATGIGSGVSSLVQNIFLTGEGTSASPYALNVFGGVVIVFAGVSLAIGLCRWVMNFLTSLGASN